MDQQKRKRSAPLEVVPRTWNRSHTARHDSTRGLSGRHSRLGELFGALFMISGIIQAVQAFQTKQSGGFCLHLLAGIFGLIGHPPDSRRAGFDAPAGGILPRRRPVPQHCGYIFTVSQQGLGIDGRHRQHTARHSPLDGMAGIGPLVHRYVHRHRHDLPRLGLAHAGTGGSRGSKQRSFGIASRSLNGPQKQDCRQPTALCLDKERGDTWNRERLQREWLPKGQSRWLP